MRKSHLKGAQSPFYKTGICNFIHFRKTIQNKVCNRCGKDLNNVSRYGWVIHHKNHDRSCNNAENFEILCKRCHQLEHNCVVHLKRTYTKRCFMCNTTFQTKANNTKYCPVCNPIYRRYKHKWSPIQIKQWIQEGNV